MKFSNRQILIVTSLVMVKMLPVSARAKDRKEECAQLVMQATSTLVNYLDSKHMVAIRNMMGGVRGIYLCPSMIKGGFFVGGQTGKCILVARHGQDWSDPVFMESHTVNVGFQFGMVDMQYMAMIMTDSAMEAMLTGSMEVSVGGGVAVGGGVTGGVSGDIKNGLDVMGFAISKGAFLGSSAGGTAVKMITDMNDAAYGPGTQPATVLSGKGGKMPAAKDLQILMQQAVKQAWWGP
jgi:SH3 domain-containing YSC84-like protein 1